MPTAARPAPAAASPRAVLRAAGRAQAGVEQLVTIVALARAAVAEAFAAVRERQVNEATATIPLDAIKDVTEGRTRLTGLVDHGYATVADVLRAGVETLAPLPGVGETTARRVVAAAQQLRDAAREALPTRIELDPTNTESTRLLQALAVWGAVRHAEETFGEDASQLAKELAADRPIGADARGLRRLFRTPRRRRAADEAVARIATRLQRAQPLLKAAADISAVTAPPAAEVWRDFERRSAVYYGLLGEVVALGGDVAAAEGYLPAEIVERVNAQRLDTSRLRDELRLRGYQSFGARFALVQRRVLLGDEMGLGKTIQAIAAMAHLAAAPTSPSAVPAAGPASGTASRSASATATSATATRSGAARGPMPLFLVVCPASVLINWSREIEAHSTLPVITLHGAQRAKVAATWRRRGGVAVTTFGSLGTLLRTPPAVAMMVVDEAHYVKNPAAKRTRAVNRLANKAERVLFLSGTPMENRIEEFQSLVGHLQPEIAGAMGRQFGVLGVRAFRRAAAPVYLRRNQQDVLTELPELVQIEEWEQFGAEDGAAYREAVGQGNFMAMRRAAFAAATAPGMSGAPVGRPPYAHGSAKLTRLLEIAGEAMANGRKVVVFSFFREVLAIVHAALGTHAHGPITGATSTVERQRIVDTFTHSPTPAVLVAQIEAGGVGLNIQAASVVILCEPQVKPSTEAQAIARAHRMGQVRSVQVHRLLTEDSVDQRMLEMLDLKAKLFDAYVRRSEIAETAPGAVDVSEVALARTIIEREQQRLAEAA